MVMSCLYPKRLDFRQGAKPMSHRSLYIINEDGERVQATQHKFQSRRVYFNDFYGEYLCEHTIVAKLTNHY